MIIMVAVVVVQILCGILLKLQTHTLSLPSIISNTNKHEEGIMFIQSLAFPCVFLQHCLA